MKHGFQAYAILKVPVNAQDNVHIYDGRQIYALTNSISVI